MRDRITQYGRLKTINCQKGTPKQHKGYPTAAAAAAAAATLCLILSTQTLIA